MKKVLYIILAGTALLLANACERVGTVYQIPEGNPCVSFPSEDAVFEMLPSDGNKITVQLWRGNTKGAASIAVEIEDGTDGVFTPAKSSFDFADGEGVASLDFTYPDINELGGQPYEIVLTIADPDQVSPSGIDEMTISATRKLTRKFIGTGVFYSDFFEEEWEQDIYTTEEAPDYYILPDCWATGTDWTFTVSDGQPKWPAAFNTGYKSSGTLNNEVWIKTGGSLVEDGVLYLIVDSYYLPTYNNYDFGSSFEAFTLPEGFSF